AVEVATACVKRAGLTGAIDLRVADVRDLERPAGGAAGLVVANPPYGERIGSESDLSGLYASFGARIRQHFAGWRVAMIASDDALLAATGLALTERHEVYNGRIPASVDLFDVAGGPPGAGRGARAGSGSIPTQQPASADDSMFANRLRKNAKRLGKWARKGNVSCYRVYDADMPEYAVAVDRYEGAGPDAGRIFAHVAEYAPPRDVDEAAATRRLSEVMEAVPRVLGCDPGDVHLKVRRRQKGETQYERVSERGVFNTVSEDGLFLSVNFTDYLDTGLFLDHRTTRRMVREKARGKRFLNLFAYTGAVTVHAAAGGAASTLSVDMSQTYLDWARRNMHANGFAAESHTYTREDITSWLGTPAAREVGPFDLIFLDPPTFSSSKRMEGTLDIQRDHVALLRAAAELLAPGGTLLFSNNFRKFKLDESALAPAGLLARDITAETIPEDFARNPRIHSAWEIVRG
ncbi:MAG: bifunctional 23S rRNA (guanine(2069)-N(7))-methyltransferase RlmK/23S rRNA (guanine(2445)-N(2))-methyltransferase RlmL, partial [Coriobacteriia bacterium]